MTTSMGLRLAMETRMLTVFVWSESFPVHENTKIFKQVVGNPGSL